MSKQLETQKCVLEERINYPFTSERPIYGPFAIKKFFSRGIGSFSCGFETTSEWPIYGPFNFERGFVKTSEWLHGVYARQQKVLKQGYDAMQFGESLTF